MSEELYLVRHGQTHFNRACDNKGWKRQFGVIPRKLSFDFNPLTHPWMLNLTGEGRRQAKKAAKALEGILEQAFMASSPEARAVQTAAYFAKTEETYFCKKLREQFWDYGRNRPNESEERAKNRFAQGIEDVLEHAKNKTPIIVAHSRVIKFYTGKYLENGEVLRIQYATGGPKILEHLKPSEL